MTRWEAPETPMRESGIVGKMGLNKAFRGWDHYMVGRGLSGRLRETVGEGS